MFSFGDIQIAPATNLRAEIESRVGVHAVWHASWWFNNVFAFRVDTEPFLYGDLSAEPADYANDGDHILLFPVDADGLCPRTWVESAWPFLEKFRSNFGFHPQEAFLYRKVTLIGQPLNTRLGVGPDVERALREASWRAVERIPCTTADELETELQKRIDLGLPFGEKAKGRM